MAHIALKSQESNSLHWIHNEYNDARRQQMLIHIYLDDFRPPPKGFMHAKSADECILLLDNYEVEILSLDYDLGWGQKTGYDVARWIAQHNKFPREIYLHSSSPSARVRMYELLDRAKPADVVVQNAQVPDARLIEINK
jgi:hypothetical protein